MKRDQVEDALDLRRADVDPEVFAVQHMCRLITNGGSNVERPDDDTALHPQQPKRFLPRVVEIAQKSGHFEQ